VTSGYVALGMTAPGVGMDHSGALVPESVEVLFRSGPFSLAEQRGPRLRSLMLDE